MRRHSALTLFAATTMIAGCASVTSMKGPAVVGGLTYYLPKRDFLITLTVSDKGRTVNAEATAAYPDPNFRYALQYSRNLIGKNELNVGVTPSGLLTSAQSTTTSSLGDVLKDLAVFAGMRTAVDPKDACAAAGTYSKLVEAKATAAPEKFCNLSIDVKPWPEVTATASMSDALADAKRPGFYYRNAKAYSVTVTEDKTSAGRSFLLFSPSEAKAQYLPIERTLFANNDAKVTFEDGVPTAYKQVADGELVALVKLPATVVAAYFDAIGNVFGQRKGALEDETEYLKAVQAAELQRLKLEQCRAALATKDEAAIQVACGA